MTDGRGAAVVTGGAGGGIGGAISLLLTARSITASELCVDGGMTAMVWDNPPI